MNPGATMRPEASISCCARAIQAPDFRYALAAHADVRGEARRARAVDERAVAHDQVVGGFSHQRLASASAASRAK
jgi:hypothetical protein